METNNRPSHQHHAITTTDLLEENDHLTIGQRVDKAIQEVVYGAADNIVDTDVNAAIESVHVKLPDVTAVSSGSPVKTHGENGDSPRRLTRGRMRAQSLGIDTTPLLQKRKKKLSMMNGKPKEKSTGKPTSSKTQDNESRDTVEDSVSPLKKIRTEVPFECDRCGLCSKTESQFARHRQLCRRTGSQLMDAVKCGYCNQILDGDRQSQMHFATVHPGLDKREESCSEAHTCPLCCLDFACLNSWLRHVHLHALQKSFECAICHATYSQQSAFHSHVLTHTVEKNYSCIACPKTFTLPISRDAHARNHAQFQCKLCQNSYKYQKTLLTHMKRVHGDDEDEDATEEGDAGKEVVEDDEMNKDTGVDAAALDDDADADWSDDNQKEIARSSRDRRSKKRVLYKAKETKTEETDFPCDLCDRVFHSTKTRREHFAKDHNGAISCIPCNLTFAHRRGLRRHRIRCHGPKTNSWVCEVCGKSFDCTYALSTHRRVHFAPKKHACSICGMKFQRAENMRRHEARHSGAKAFMCDSCGACYSTKFILQKHAEIHVDPKDKTFLCETCGDGFSRQNILKWHIQSDCGKKRQNAERPLGVPTRGRIPGVQNMGSRQSLPFPCPMCKKGFKEQEILDRHIKGFHTNDQRLICEECGIRFRTEATLKTHRAIHTSLKHKCRFCDKEFLRETLKAIHEREKHTGDKPFKCKFCEESFTRKGKLAAHQLIHYGRQIECEYCNMLFAKVDTKNKHMKKHTNQRPYICNLCNKAFKEKYNLEIHMRTHSNQKAFVCKTCGKKYNESNALRAHMRTHDQGGLPQFACDICDQLFESSEALVAHTESHTDQRQQTDHSRITTSNHQILPLQTHPAIATQVQVQAQIMKPQETIQIQTFDLHAMEGLRSPQPQQQQQQQHPAPQQDNVQAQQHLLTHQTLEPARQFEIQVFDQFQRPTFSMDPSLARVQGVAPEQIVIQRPQTFTVDNLQNIQRPQMTLMDFQRGVWNINP